LAESVKKEVNIDKGKRDIAICVLIIGSAVAAIGGCLASLGNVVTEWIMGGLVAFIGGLICGRGGNLLSIAKRKH
jgi:hypothetical protein